VTTSHLPPSLGDSVQRRDGPATIHLLIPPPLPLFSNDVVTVLRPHVEFEHLPFVRKTQIPVEPPTTAEQAVLWSKNYWPCTFNPASQTIQQAPPSRLLQTTQAKLDKPARLQSYLGLAQRAAAECVNGALGREVAAVVVDPVMDEVIAVAGDARWFEQTDALSIGKSHSDGLAEGRPEQHALMRAIAMVAEKEARRQSRNEDSSSATAENPGTGPGQRAMTPIEKFYATTQAETETSREQHPGMPPVQSAERRDAYLCNGLDVYLTHEPCIACSMAMIHSRFRACVFMRRMPPTGGLCAEKDDGGLAYGLFWRRELNWRVLTFRYLPAAGGLREEGGKEEVGDRVDEHVEAVFPA